MKTCERCGAKFDPEEAKEQFEMEAFLLEYDDIEPCLCGECAIEALQIEDNGVFYFTCERCGTRFDLFEETSKLSSMFHNTEDVNLTNYWSSGIICADCAGEEITKELQEAEDLGY